MAEGHIVVDLAGSVIAGKSASVAAWQRFFIAFPDYRNEFEEYRTEGPMVTATGRSRCSDARVDGPAIWTAKAEGDRITERRVYEDTDDIRRNLKLKSRGQNSE